MPRPIQPAALPSLRVLVNRVLAANAMIELAISRMTADQDGDLSDLIAAVDKLTALAMVHAPPPEQTQQTRRQKAMAARDATAQAAADAVANLRAVSDSAVHVDPVLGAANVSAVTVTTA